MLTYPLLDGECAKALFALSSRLVAVTLIGLLSEVGNAKTTIAKELLKVGVRLFYHCVYINLIIVL